MTWRTFLTLSGLELPALRRPSRNHYRVFTIPTTVCNHRDLIIPWSEFLAADPEVLGSIPGADTCSE
jgi:hypothetical protein